MTFQNKRSYKRNSKRLVCYIQELNANLSEEQYSSLLEKLDSAEIVLMNKLNHLSWIPAEIEVKIIKHFSQSLGDYRHFHNASKKAMIEFLGQTLSHNPFYNNCQDLFYALPSFIFFWMNLELCKIYYDNDHFYLELIFEQDENVETIFISAIIQALIEYIDIPQAGLYISSMTIPEKENTNELIRLNPLIEHNAQFVRIKIFIPGDLLDKSIDASVANVSQISLSNHKESQKQIFVKQVLARSARIFRDKRELSTAVEYLNFANDALEKKIEESNSELAIAKNIQNGLIPQYIPDWQGLRFFKYSKALATVSGDFYDYFNLDNGSLGVLVADVCGHGVPAALISAVAKISFSNHCHLPPRNVLSNVNMDLIRHVKMEGYLTAVYLNIDKNLVLNYCLGGIPAPILLRASTGKTDILKGNGALLGMFPNASELFENQSLQLEAGDKIILFTDGITEAINIHQEQLGVERLQEFIEQTVGMNVEDTGNHILQKYQDYIIGEQIHDDTTLMVIEISPHLEYFHKYCESAKIHFQNNELEKAVEDLRNAIHIFPARPEVLYSLAKMLLKLDRGIEAHDIANQLLNIIPNHSGATVIKALHALKNNNLDIAETLLQQALALQANNKQALYHLIRVSAMNNKHPKARQYLEEYVHLHPEDTKTIDSLKQYLKVIVDQT